MNQQKDLEYFMKLNYNVILKRKDSYYYLFISELSIIVENEDLDKAYKKLEKDKVLYFKKVIKLDAQDTVKEPMHLVERKKLFSDLSAFFIKMCLIAVVFLITIFASLPFVDSFVVSRINKLPVTLIREIPNKIFNKIENMSVEKKEQRILELRKMVQQLKPFIDEVHILFDDEPHKLLNTIQDTSRVEIDK